jgi:hypothetical protein
MAALSAIHHLVEGESHFIIATHSPILPAYPRSRILLLDKSGIAEVKYEDTEHYSITKQFLNNHQKMINTSQGWSQTAFPGRIPSEKTLGTPYVRKSDDIPIKTCKKKCRSDQFRQFENIPPSPQLMSRFLPLFVGEAQPNKMP